MFPEPLWRGAWLQVNWGVRPLRPPAPGRFHLHRLNKPFCFTPIQWSDINDSVFCIDFALWQKFLPKATYRDFRYLSKESREGLKVTYYTTRWSVISHYKPFWKPASRANRSTNESINPWTQRPMLCHPSRCRLWLAWWRSWRSAPAFWACSSSSPASCACGSATSATIRRNPSVSRTPTGRNTNSCCAYTLGHQWFSTWGSRPRSGSQPGTKWVSQWPKIMCWPLPFSVFFKSNMYLECIYQTHTHWAMLTSLQQTFAWSSKHFLYSLVDTNIENLKNALNITLINYYYVLVQHLFIL